MDKQPEADMKVHLQKLIAARLEDSDMLPLNPRNDQHRQIVEELFQTALGELNIALDRKERRTLFEHVSGYLLGWGPLEALLADENISEIIVIGPKKVYVRRHGIRERTTITFDDEQQLQEIINRSLLHRLDVANPIGNQRGGAGSVIAVAGYTVSNTGSALIFRQKHMRPVTSEDLLKSGTMTPEEFQFLHSCVQAKMNILISGNNESGKTTLLNVLAGFVPNDELIVTVEEQYREELQLRQDMLIALHSRPAGVSEYPPITVGELIIHALKMRPERLVVGELRAGETSPLANADYTKWMATACVPHPSDVTPQLAATTEVIVHMRSLRNETYQIANIFKVQGINDGIFVLTSWSSEIGQPS